MLWWVSVRLNQGPSLSIYTIVYPQVSVISSGSLTALQPQILTIFTKFPSLPSLLPSPPNGNVFSAVMQSLVFAPAPWFSVCRLPKFYHTGREQSSGRKLDISFWWFSDFQLTSSQSRASFSISFLLLKTSGSDNTNNGDVIFPASSIENTIRDAQLTCYPTSPLYYTRGLTMLMFLGFLQYLPSLITSCLTEEQTTLTDVSIALCLLFVRINQIILLLLQSMTLSFSF